MRPLQREIADSGMKPPSFDFEAPRTLAEAADLLADAGEDAKLLAGGQSLIPLLNLRFASPSLLIDINAIDELAQIRSEPGQLRLGALVRHSSVERDLIVADISQQDRLRQDMFGIRPR